MSQVQVLFFSDHSMACPFSERATSVSTSEVIFFSIDDSLDKLPRAERTSQYRDTQLAFLWSAHPSHVYRAFSTPIAASPQPSHEVPSALRILDCCQEEAPANRFTLGQGIDVNQLVIKSRLEGIVKWRLYGLVRRRKGVGILGDD